MTGLPIGTKTRNGPRWAESDAAVVHVPGATEIPARKQAAKRKATAASPRAPIDTATSPLDQLRRSDPVAYQRLMNERFAERLARRGPDFYIPPDNSPELTPPLKPARKPRSRKESAPSNEPDRIPPELDALILEDIAQREAAETQPAAANKASAPPGGDGSGDSHRRLSSSGSSPHGSSGAPHGDVHATFIYEHPDLPPPHFYLLVEKRVNAAGKRNFFQYHWTGGRWNPEVKGTYAERKIPYRLPELKAALAADSNTDVQITEGEKDADTLGRLGFVATTNPGGAAQWTDDLTAWLRVLGVRRIVLHEDHDKAGIKRTGTLAPALSSFASVRVARYLDVPGGKDATAGEDVTYWIETLGHSKEDLAERIAQAAPADAISFADTPLTTQEWLVRDLPEPDLLLGHILTTTTRMLLFADTGLGKTNFAMAASGHAGAGKNFLHWHCSRLGRVLYIDGEMSLKLFRERITDVVRRLGEPPPGAFFFNKGDVPGFAPLNTRDGQAAVWALIEEVERRCGQKLDAICFDSIMALLLGDMKEEDAWRDTMPLVHALTARHIGQVWIHHTGHDTSHGYGTKTREWQMDSVLHLEALDNTPPDLIAFRLSFPKARERTPANRLDFTEATVTLSNDQWSGVIVSNARGKIDGLTRKFYDALVAATASSSITPTGPFATASLEEWRTRCLATGLLDPSKADSARALFSKHKLKLLAANWIACSEALAWVLP